MVRCARGSLCPLACAAYARTAGTAQRPPGVGVSAAGATHVATPCRSPAAKRPSPRIALCASTLLFGCRGLRPWTSPCMMSSVGGRARTRPFAPTPRATHWHVASRRPPADRAGDRWSRDTRPFAGVAYVAACSGSVADAGVRVALARTRRAGSARVCRRCTRWRLG